MPQKEYYRACLLPCFYEVRHHLEQRLLVLVTNTKCGAHEKSIADLVVTLRVQRL